MGFKSSNGVEFELWTVKMFMTFWRRITRMSLQCRVAAVAGTRADNLRLIAPRKGSRCVFFKESRH